jgi:mRNA (2'-O-methyladenosine-N6-)-methyltransferase
MADPPWDIHMSVRCLLSLQHWRFADSCLRFIQLPYGTMNDDEMKSMPIPALQDEGLLFLWVTGRAMELGRECMQTWGCNLPFLSSFHSVGSFTSLLILARYTRVDEMVWVKTNQVPPNSHHYA